jgi:hypothetical protein
LESETEKERHAMSGTPATTPDQQHKTFWSSLKGFFHKVGYYVSEAFVRLFGEDAAKHFAVASLEVLKSDLGKIVVTAVKEAEALAAGTDKKAAAFAAIVAQAKTQGISARDSLINMLIELAVQAFSKSSFGQGVQSIGS